MTNISWGQKIAGLYIGFVLLIIGMVTLSMNQKIELVSSDYYAKELKYQDKINEINNANALTESLSSTVSSSGVEIKFPSQFQGKEINGEILFFRPSDAYKDYSTPVKPNKDLVQNIRISDLSSGMYKMQVSWQVDKINYFKETVVVIP